MNVATIIITKNEEDNIVDVLDSVRFSKQIIVVDNGSTDRTRDLAKKNGAQVINGKFDNFSKQREVALKDITTDWILYVDADERVSAKLKEEIEKVILGRDSKDAYKLNRRNFYFGKYEWPYKEEVLRLFRKDALKGWTGEIHESPVFVGEVGNLSGYLDHYTHKDLSSMLRKTINWSDQEAQIRLLSKHPKMSWWRFPRVMIPTFIKYYIRQKGYRAGMAGLIESIFQTYSIFITYAKLWEKQNMSKSS